MTKPLSIGGLVRSGELYDLTYRFTDDIPFYLKWAQRVAGPVLELCCGTGRVLIPLAEAGVAVSGVDFTQSMLAQASKRAQERNLEVPLHLADIRAVNTGVQYRLVTIPFNSVEDFYTPEDVNAIFDTVKRHLAPGGLFIFDVNNPNHENLHAGRRNVPLTKRFAWNGHEVVIEEKMAYDAQAKVNRIVRTYQMNGETTEHPLDLRVYFPGELEGLLQRAGLDILHKFGTFRESEFGADSPKQIFVAKRAESG